jgi:hypothetical protein
MRTRAKNCPAVRGNSPRRALIRSAIGLIAISAVVSGNVGAGTAAASVTSLARSVLQRGAADHHGSDDMTPRISGIPNISKVTTASLSLTNFFSPQTSTTTKAISATYSADSNTLIVHWGNAQTLTISGPQPLGPGSTVAEGVGFPSSLSGSILVTGSQRCDASQGLGEASISQMMTDSSGTVSALALQFLCLAAPGFSITTLDSPSADINFSAGTIGLNVPETTRAPGYSQIEQNGTVSNWSGNDAGSAIFEILSAFNIQGVSQPIVGMATTPLDGGYWLASKEGGVFSYGDAGFYGSAGATPLNQPIVGMAATPDAKGYWLVAADGGVFSYGDAGYYGSTGGMHLNQPIVGMATTPDGRGYWLVAADGGVFSFGNAGFHGSTGGMRLNQPIVGMASSSDGNGYWLVAADGGIFSFGDAGFHGSTGGMQLNQPIVGMAASPDGNGYWLTAADGGVFSFGDAPFGGGLGGTNASDVVGIVT